MQALDRCLHYTFDAKASPLLNKKATSITLETSQIGIILRNDVPASMRNNICNAEACVTKDELLACQCDCQCGASAKEKIACVHISPVLYQYAMLLHEGLSQHILIELCHRWSPALEKSLQSEREKVRENIAVLMRADGTDEDNVAKAEASRTIHGVLLRYAVGTEKPKLKILKMTDPSELIPLRKLKLKSSTLKSKASLIKSDEPDKISDKEVSTYVPSCIDIITSCCGVPGFNIKECDIPRFRLLNIRAWLTKWRKKRECNGAEI